MRQIWKFPLQETDTQTLEIPQGYEVLSVDVQQGTPCLWVSVIPANPKTDVVVHTVGTGHAYHLPDQKFIGTYFMHGGALVWHVFI